eukprot:gb/GEZJ01008805.1/.p1 GENE.gb/GEZJ01008805.1/~~gb/GEZJ01008805.1/.p1  ORF type:complete len:182 (-),score=15.20 gb/GEZJ01008805.1/:24-569(-)
MLQKLMRQSAQFLDTNPVTVMLLTFLDEEEHLLQPNVLKNKIRHPYHKNVTEACKNEVNHAFHTQQQKATQHQVNKVLAISFHQTKERLSTDNDCNEKMMMLTTSIQHSFINHVSLKHMPVPNERSATSFLIPSDRQVGVLPKTFTSYHGNPDAMHWALERSSRGLAYLKHRVSSEEGGKC